MLTKITRYKTEGKKRSITHAYRKKIRSALLSLTRNVILCNTPEHVDAAAALAQVISSSGMNNRNYLLFLVLLETNNPAVIDILIGERNPFLLFSPIKPNWFLIKETFRILAKYKGSELSVKALLALLGVIQNAYKTSKDGYKIYPLRMSDVYNIGKHLDKSIDQLDPRNRLLLEILFDIYYVGIDSDDRSTKQIGIKANDIRMAFFDNTKRLLDAIPDVLLVKDVIRDAPRAEKLRMGPDPRARDGGPRGPRSAGDKARARPGVRACRREAGPRKKGSFDKEDACGEKRAASQEKAGHRDETGPNGNEGTCQDTLEGLSVSGALVSFALPFGFHYNSFSKPTIVPGNVPSIPEGMFQGSSAKDRGAAMFSHIGSIAPTLPAEMRRKCWEHVFQMPGNFGMALA